MSLILAIPEMMGHIDSVVGALPAPSGSGGQLPDDFVVLRSVEKKVTGIGRISSESAVDNMEEQAGALLAAIEVQLWGRNGADVISRSRELIINMLDIQNEVTANGIFAKAKLSAANGPEFIDGVKFWRISVGLTVDFEYRFVDEPGVGEIEQIHVDAQGELEEDFIVTGN